MKFFRFFFRKFKKLKKLDSEWVDWRDRNWAPPCPAEVKHGVLVRLGVPEGVWVETGTYMGDTTSFLSRRAKYVYSIEPEPALFKRAKNLFVTSENVDIINGTSEQVLPTLVSRLSGDVSFWLDGHYSAGATYKADNDTPIRLELALISEALPRLTRVAVFVDDVRCFDPIAPEYSQYPPRLFLVQWAEQNNLSWSIEHDIFIARNF